MIRLDEPTDIGVPEKVIAEAPAVRVVLAIDMPPSGRSWAFSPLMVVG